MKLQNFPGFGLTGAVPNRDYSFALLKTVKKIPTLILHGEEDNLVDVRFNKHFLENIPNII